jgi:hypothetical protein
MSTRTVILVVAIVAAGFSHAEAQETKPAPATRAEPPSSPKTPEHAHLARFAGEWDIKLTMHGGPQPVTVSAVASEKLVFDGLYLVTTVSGDLGGQIFEGRGITGYDRHAKEFVGVWVSVESN